MLLFLQNKSCLVAILLGLLGDGHSLGGSVLLFMSLDRLSPVPRITCAPRHCPTAETTSLFSSICLPLCLQLHHPAIVNLHLITFNSVCVLFWFQKKLETSTFHYTEQHPARSAGSSIIIIVFWVEFSLSPLSLIVPTCYNMVWEVLKKKKKNYVLQGRQAVRNN